MVQEIVHNGWDRPFAVRFCRKSEVIGKNHNAPITIFELTKRGWAHKDALRIVALHLNVEESAISSHGLKDRHALTSQRIGIAGEFAPRFEHPTIWLRQIGPARRELKRGGNAGNRFSIFVRSDAHRIDATSLSEVPNLFGVQRIGSQRECEIGRLLLEGQFFGAAKLMTALRIPAVKAYREALAATKDWRTAWLHTSMKFHFDFIIQKWQSLLWNKLVEECLTFMLPDAFPVWSPECSDLYGALWAPAKLDGDALQRLRRFERPTIIRPKNLSYRREPDGWRFKFDLQSGAYATVVLGRVFKLAEPARG